MCRRLFPDGLLIIAESIQPMLRTLLRELWKSPAERLRALADLEELPYYDPSALARLSARKASSLRENDYQLLEQP